MYTEHHVPLQFGFLRSTPYRPRLPEHCSDIGYRGNVVCVPRWPLFNDDKHTVRHKANPWSTLSYSVASHRALQSPRFYPLLLRLIVGPHPPVEFSDLIII